MPEKALSRLETDNGKALAAADDESFSGRQFITALARGLDVLAAFRAGDPSLSNLELAKRCQLPRSTISRLTQTLTDLGYLNYHEGFGCYELGGAMLSLGHVARESYHALEQARPIMMGLAELSNANVGIGIRDRLTMVYLTVCPPPIGIGLRFQPGSKVPIMQTAMGLAYLASRSPAELKALGPRLLKKNERDTASVTGTIQAAQEEYRRHGFCSSVGKWYEDVNGIAAPIPWTAVADTLVLNCGAPSALMPKEHMLEEIGPRLVSAAAAIADMLKASAPAA
ncbi:MAG TPA: IclR family transcriptional regulator [Sphingomonas sp.]|uniref:IclR family transcriptional regulator n=1 Tax=Sphingomonas sp. TaxID=28214 RepID=UPI002C653DAA|nr:IclR family transcriptional regulator [Sphingomonas sp.]HMI17984.1 IclR family transcriptional regulator [Sphingomonas sp.]